MIRIAFALWLLAALALASQEAPSPAFDVVSVKHSGNTSVVLQAGPGRVTLPTRGFRFTGGKVTCNLPLSSIVQEAYGVRDWQIQGPEWLGVELYDFAAIMPDGTSRENARLMMRTMLADRFGLKFRREPKEFSVYALVAIKGTSKLEEVVPTPETYSYKNVRGGLEAEPGMPLRVLADKLSRPAGKPVIDQTGLTGMYKVRLHWDADTDVSGGGAGGPVMVRNFDTDTGILSAISQIGLKLEARKKMYDVLIIDKVAKEPTGN
jgi:uncharacterized protein (TIGR03435 family)